MSCAANRAFSYFYERFQPFYDPAGLRIIGVENLEFPFYDFEWMNRYNSDDMIVCVGGDYAWIKLGDCETMIRERFRYPYCLKFELIEWKTIKPGDRK